MLYKKVVNMANPKKKSVTETQIKTHNQEKFRANKKWIIPLVFIVIFVLIFVFYQIGKHQISNSENSNSNIYEFPEKLIIGKPYNINFTHDLIFLLDPNGTTEPSIYAFYLGSNAESPPVGLTLDTDGVLSGTPTGKGSTFEVCIMDVNERTACRIYVINTNYVETENNNVSTNEIPVDNNTLTWQEKISEIENKYNIEIEYKSLPILNYSRYSANVTVLSEEDNDALSNYVDIFYVEFNRYPQDFIKNVGLKKVAFVKNLSVIGQYRGAMPIGEIETLFYDIYIGNYNKLHEQEDIHHEFYHLIEWNINGDMYYKDPTWAAFNDPTFTYGSGGASAYTNLEEYKNKVIENGFVSTYSTYGLEEDKAEIFANLMVPELYRSMILRTANDTILNNKVNYMKNFLSKHSQNMNEDFWNKILVEGA